jgi:hypothetical protein
VPVPVPVVDLLQEDEAKLELPAATRGNRPDLDAYARQFARALPLVLALLLVLVLVLRILACSTSGSSASDVNVHHHDHDHDDTSTRSSRQ